ncbi:hypothetical protein SNEBB_001621 [Seison nebaliae]|nr:hypothetical protein SNEBB_001621 [Seison nebaliae]
MSEVREKKKLFFLVNVANFGDQLNERSFYNLFHKFGPIERILKDHSFTKNDTYVDIYFLNLFDAARACVHMNEYVIETLEESKIGKYHLKVRLHKRTRMFLENAYHSTIAEHTVRVENFDNDISLATLKDVFGNYGTIRSTAVYVQPSSAFAIVVYEQCLSAFDATVNYNLSKNDEPEKYSWIIKYEQS